MGADAKDKALAAEYFEAVQAAMATQVALKPTYTTAGLVERLNERCGAYIETAHVADSKPGHIFLVVVLVPEQKQQVINVRKLIEEVLHDYCAAGTTYTIGVS